MPIVTDGLVGYWNSKQGVSGSTWENIAPATTGKYSATITGAYVTSNGMHFDGGANQIEFPIPEGYETDGISSSIEFRLNLNENNSDYQDIISHTHPEWSGEDHWRYLLYINTAKKEIGLTGVFDSLGNNLIMEDVFSLEEDVYLTITANKETEFISVYMNGVYIDGYTPEEVLSLASTGSFVLGSFLGDNPKGIIDNIRLYTKALTPQEIQQNYAVRSEIGLISSPIKARLHTNGLFSIEGDLIEGQPTSLKENGDFHTGEIIESDEVKLTETGFEVVSFKEGGV